ncbi:hypothetical protein UFB30_15690 [Jeotgalibacillus sp. HH7-29]|uniref:Uncharacterized protein n=1 Tax=Jeotgalibacillus haloalkalitolerans TaxID=3104292 RepID=A0ABU5KR08_9BACL|nr:hypothetical protein [Jeotgalibacillus sp. HH7-29]
MEKFEVNPNPVNVNHKHYYEAIYTNFKGEVTGTAILGENVRTFYQEMLKRKESGSSCDKRCPGGKVLERSNR